MQTARGQNRAMKPVIDPAAAKAARDAERIRRMATPRLSREQRTIAAMLRLYCRDHHPTAPRHEGDGRLCTECAGLLDYARKRLSLCPYGPAKPTCVNCPIHCYGRAQREAVREVMRHAGPRMLWRHPWLAIAHLFDGRRPAPAPPRKR